ncbi:ACT domain-containing protein, partial [Craterilacuibacter sp.]|uniref:ACT domain-containing protein n=1 Tax=Craterilacuibacter sp. TaxID=2870909 RepID=UPI003F2F23FF
TLADIAAAISNAAANIESVDTQDSSSSEGYIHIHFRLQVSDLAHLEKALVLVTQVASVMSAERA